LGDPRASYAIASWYERGHSPVVNRKNFKKAVRFLIPAVEAKVAYAVFDYAISLELGQGVEKNENAALCYYILALSLGCTEALKEIARMHYYGIVLPKDRKLAGILFEWDE